MSAVEGVEIKKFFKNLEISRIFISFFFNICYLSSAALSRCYLSCGAASRCYLSSAAVSRCYLSSAAVSRCYLSSAAVSRCYLSSASVSRCYLSSLAVSRCYLSSAAVSRCNDPGLRENGTTAEMSRSNSSRIWGFIIYKVPQIPNIYTYIILYA